MSAQMGTSTEILLNLSTGEVRRNAVTPDQYFRYHDAFTPADQDAGWKQVAIYSAGVPEDEIAINIEQAKAIYLKQSVVCAD